MQRQELSKIDIKSGHVLTFSRDATHKAITIPSENMSRLGLFCSCPLACLNSSSLAFLTSSKNLKIWTPKIIVVIILKCFYHRIMCPKDTHWKVNIRLLLHTCLSQNLFRIITVIILIQTYYIIHTETLGLINSVNPYVQFSRKLIQRWDVTVFTTDQSMKFHTG